MARGTHLGRRLKGGQKSYRHVENSAFEHDKDFLDGKGLVEPRGVEPLTSCMPCKRSPN